MRIYAPSKQQSVKDLPGHTKLKFRCEQLAGDRGGLQHSLPPLPPLAAATYPAPSPAHCRQPGQNTADELAAGDMRSKLEEKERKHYLQTKSHNFEGRYRRSKTARGDAGSMYPASTHGHLVELAAVQI